MLFRSRARRIPNALTLVGAAVGLLLRAPHGGAVVVDGAAGMGIAVLLALPPFALGFLGGGDVKLLGAVGAFLGLGHLPGALAFVALAGGVLALLEAARHHALKRALANPSGFARNWGLLSRAGVPAAFPRIATRSSGLPRSGGSARNASQTPPVRTESARHEECTATPSFRWSSRRPSGRSTTPMYW